MMDQTYTNMQLCTCSFLKELCFNTWNNFRIIIFPPWHRNDTVSFSFFLMWTSLPSSGSSRVPTFGTIFPRWGACHPDKLASLPIPLCHGGTYFFTDIILALLLNHIFKFTFRYVKSSSFWSTLSRLTQSIVKYHVCKINAVQNFQTTLLESTISFITTCLKTSMFKNLVYKWQRPSRWSAHMALQSDWNEM